MYVGFGATAKAESSVLRGSITAFCADRPVTGAVLVVFDSGGREVTRAASNPDGFVQIVLDPGSYRLEPRPIEGLLGTAAPFEIDIRAGETVDVTIFYDTGIR